MTRKVTLRAAFAAGLALVAGLAWGGYGDERAPSPQRSN
jgi:hypothetical protein